MNNLKLSQLLNVSKHWQKMKRVLQYKYCALIGVKSITQKNLVISVTSKE